MKVQKRLINNYYSVQIKLVIHFIWPYELCKSRHAKFQGTIMYREFYII
jgi:hypothetical protein